MCILPGVSHILVRFFLRKSRFGLIYSYLKIKSTETVCKNNVFTTLSKIDLKYIKKLRIKSCSCNISVKIR